MYSRVALGCGERLGRSKVKGWEVKGQRLGRSKVKGCGFQMSTAVEVKGQRLGRSKVNGCGGQRSKWLINAQTDGER